ncbi:hypothetical protein F2P81_014683 [Scophthalmus maximus]|uniref:Tetraspanin n=1 Tax=Scophthalmus maximus TaxID=52904 RepID=A0A6A4SE04_SCOMX|nr:hypothetical protein F2P81_014683 [Scophthalmus maximus]
MALDGCGIACKYVLILFNIIFAVVGFAFLILGMWLRFSNETRGLFEIPSLNSSAFVTGVTILIALGSVMLIVVVFGDYGVCNEKRCALQVIYDDKESKLSLRRVGKLPQHTGDEIDALQGTKTDCGVQNDIANNFSVLLALLATAEIVCGVLAYSRRYEVGLNFAQFYTSMYLLYAKNGGDPAIGVSLTFIHYMNCPEVIVTIFDSKASLVMGIFIGTAALLITTLVCAITLLKQIKRVNQEITTYYSTVY